MNDIFILTDNLFWYEKITSFFENREEKIDIFCAPSSKNLFREQLEDRKVQTIDLKNEFRVLTDYKLGISAHSKQIFPEILVKTVRCVNIHPGLNPHNRGWYPQIFSILNKKPIGVTIHIMDAEIDHGNIIAQIEAEITEVDTSRTIYDRLLELEYSLFVKNFDNICNPHLFGSAPASDGNYNSINDFRELCELDLRHNGTLQQHIDLLRALTHPPYQNGYFLDENGGKVYVSISFDKK